MIPPHYAAELGDVEIVQALLAAGADINAEDDESGTVAPLLLESRGGPEPRR